MLDLKRREFITLLGGAAAAWPLAARAQQPAMPVTGFLRSTSLAPFESLVHAFRQGLEETGFFEGQNIAVEYRYADDQEERLPVLVAELFRRPVSVIVANQAAASVAGSPAAFTGAVTELSSIKRLTIKHTVYVAAVVYRNKQTADQRSDANSEEFSDSPKSNSPLPSLSQASPMPSALSRPLCRRSFGWWTLGQRCYCSWCWVGNGCCCQDWLWRRFRAWVCFHYGCWWLGRLLSWALLAQILDGTDEPSVRALTLRPLSGHRGSRPTIGKSRPRRD